MKRATAAVALMLLAMGAGLAGAAEQEGSAPQDLAQRKPPRPNDVYVAVLPFWGVVEGQSTVARACVMLNLMRHGFRIAPKGSASVRAAARATDVAVRRDPEYEPLARMEVEDAARVGRALGADWVIYGQIGELRTESAGGEILPQKVGVLDLRLWLIEARSGQVLFWRRTRDTVPGGGPWPAKASAIERRLLTKTINEIFEDISAAMPDHYVGAEVTPEMVLELVTAMER